MTQEEQTGQERTRDASSMFVWVDLFALTQLFSVDE
jgi:hypothetical protein